MLAATSQDSKESKQDRDSEDVQKPLEFIVCEINNEICEENYLNQEAEDSDSDFKIKAIVFTFKTNKKRDEFIK